MENELGSRVVGREGLCARILAGLAGRSVAVLHGVPGIGKTTVVWELLGSARSTGRPTAYVEARARETFSSLLGRLAAELGIALETPSSSLLFGAIEAHGAFVAIDSAEEVDEARLRELLRHAHGTLRRGWLVCATRRLPKWSARDRLDIVVEEVPLLEPADVRAFLRGERADDDEAAPWPGHPLLLKLRLALGGGATPATRSGAGLDETVRSLVQETLGGLGRSERIALALLAAAPFAWKLERLPALVPTEALDALERRGVLQRHDARCRVHPLFAASDAVGPAPRPLLRRAGAILAKDASKEPTAGLAAATLSLAAGDDAAAMHALHDAAPLVGFHGLRDAFEAILGRLRLRGRWRDVARIDRIRVRQGLDPDERELRALAKSRDREVSQIARFELARLAQSRGRFEEARAHASNLAAALPPTDELGWLSRCRLVFYCAELGDLERAAILVEDLARTAATPAQRGMELGARCELHLREGRPRAVLAAIRRARSHGAFPPALAAYALSYAGQALAQLGRLKRALVFCERACAIFSVHLPAFGVGYEADRARLLVWLGRSDEAARVVEAALRHPEIARAHARTLLEARAMARLARGALASAAADLAASAPLPRGLEVDQEGRWWTEARLLHEEGRVADALARVDRAIAEPRARSAYARGTLEVARAALLVEEGRDDEARAALDAAVGVLSTGRIRLWRSRLLRHRARLALEAGRLDEAIAEATAAASHARSGDAPADLAAALRASSAVHRARGSESDADEALERATGISEAAGDRLGLAEALADRVALDVARRAHAAASTRLVAARATLEGTGAMRISRRLDRLTVAAHLARGDLPRARSALADLDRKDPWRARLEVGIAVATRGEARDEVRALARNLGRRPRAAATRLLREAEALGVASAGRATILSREGRREASREEAACAVHSGLSTVVLDLTDGVCLVRGRSCGGISRSPILTRVLAVLLETAPRPVRPADLFAAVWGPPERHEGWSNLVWVTIGRLRKLLSRTRGAAEASVPWIEEGYALSPSVTFLLVGLPDAF